MAILTDPERSVAHAISKLAYCNPFLPERIQHEREVLARLRDGDLDPAHLLRVGMQRLSYVPGGLHANPYH